MHAVLTLTLMHDRYLRDQRDNVPQFEEAFHNYRTTALFNKVLSSPIDPADREPIWATCILLGIISFNHVDAEVPEQAWPLRPPSPMDLNWLAISNGKRPLWQKLQGLAQDSPFQVTAPKQQWSLNLSQSTSRLTALPRELLELCDLRSATVVDDRNPYLAAALALGKAWPETEMLACVLNFLFFISNVEPAFQASLRQKDPCALLLLLFWYAKVPQQLWWVSRRAILEGQAIRIYLERYYAYNKMIMNLLTLPQTFVGDAS